MKSTAGHTNQIISSTGFETQGEPATVSYLLQQERNITTKSTKDIKRNQIMKFFVIFVCFVVNKYYPKIEEKIG